MYSCLIVDDQKEAVDLIKDHILKTPSLTFQNSFTDPIEALGYLDQHKVDVIFLDIEMPEMTGLDFIESLKEKWGTELPKIVLETGFSDYALDSYEYGVADYIMKPVSYKRFIKAVDRIINDLNRLKPTQNGVDFFFADVDGKKIKINFKDIIYLEGARNYLIIATQNKRMITYRSMGSVEELLPKNKFIRVHKSYIVAIDQIESLNGGKIVVNVKEDKNIPIGITYRKDVLRQLQIK